MGMFDELHWYYDLPDDDHIGLVFQTKDFNCNLDQYMVDKHGKLYLKNKPDHDVSFPSTKWDTFDEPMWFPVNFTGDINFYSYDDCGFWIEYKAHFINDMVLMVYISEE